MTPTERRETTEGIRAVCRDKTIRALAWLPKLIGDVLAAIAIPFFMVINERTTPSR